MPSMNKEQQKEFALQQLAPYLKDPSTCGFSGFSCQYLTSDKKMCVAGKNMSKKALQRFKNNSDSIYNILSDNSQGFVFKPEVVGNLTNQEWTYVQKIHDSIAEKDEKNLIANCNRLGLFTYTELREYANNLI